MEDVKGHLGSLISKETMRLQGAPRIFKKTPSSSSSQFYSKEFTGFRWIRDVDFTPSSCIGQSFALCLELSPRHHLPSFFQTLVGYKETYGPFILQKGSSFSSISNLVPIITPPQAFDISYKILFKINALVQNGYLPGPTIDDKFFRLVDSSEIHSDYVKHALEKLFHLKECCYEPQKWLKHQYLSYYSSNQLPWKLNISLDDSMVCVHRVQITPSKVYFCGPEANLSNRVVRRFIDEIDNFFRVSFVDEELNKLYSVDSTSIKGTRNVGVDVPGRNDWYSEAIAFEYLANYMVNYSLGTIANAHTVFADKEPKKAMSAKCIKLAKLFFIAVDFSKTGVPANLPHNLCVHEYPDFMNKPNKPTYVSNGVLGKLFRGVKDVSSDVNTLEIFTREVATKCYDPDMEVDGFEKHLRDAFDYKTRNDLEQINCGMKSLRKEVRAWFNEKGSKSTYDNNKDEDEEYAKVSAWYHVMYHPDYWGRYNEGFICLKRWYEMIRRFDVYVLEF
ncbi:unnamed protein product [Citrullus colocynthis]|uniref:RNA-dependent RNA polymerase n=1 Tax=Citrullus colocynthis TaxID=252529 RepID=A0ABP0XT47_9ROSI